MVDPAPPARTFPVRLVTNALNSLTKCVRMVSVQMTGNQFGFGIQWIGCRSESGHRYRVQSPWSKCEDLIVRIDRLSRSSSLESVVRLRCAAVRLAGVDARAPRQLSRLHHGDRAARRR